MTNVLRCRKLEIFRLAKASEIAHHSGRLLRRTWQIAVVRCEIEGPPIGRGAGRPIGRGVPT